MKYAIGFDDASIIPLDSGTKTYKYETYQQTDTFEEAKELLVDYWASVKLRTSITLKEVRKIKESDCL